MRIPWLLLLMLGFVVSLTHAQEDISVALADGTEIPVRITPAEGRLLFLWLPSEAGSQAVEDTLVQQLRQLQIEVWQLDLLEAHFLPTAPSSMDQLPGSDISALIDYAFAKTGKRIFLVTTGRGAIPMLRGARAWQKAQPTSSALAGAILMSPKFFVETPDPGQAARLMPIVHATNLPILIFQPRQSPWFWKLDSTIPALEQGGSDVFVWRLNDVRDRFYFRPDAVEPEHVLTARLPKLLSQVAQLLETLPQQPRRAAPLAGHKPPVQIGKKERTLKVYGGDPRPPALSLNDLAGQPVSLRDYRGQVVLVNFWASWCPPCVHEMPSMQRLADKFANQPFTILAVNMAEDPATIRRFLASKINVQFPILLDNDGAALKRWGVFAFPTSYVLDKQGSIRYALFGGIDWDTPTIQKTIEALLQEPKTR